MKYRNNACQVYTWHFLGKECPCMQVGRSSKVYEIGELGVISMFISRDF